MALHPGIELIWALGNHDLSKDSSKLGTVAFVGALLGMTYPQFTLVSKPTLLDGGVYIIPHLANQDRFDLALEQIPEEATTLLIHTCYDNNFAVQQDHSLNLARTQAAKLRDRGITTIIGHEHQGRTAWGGKLIIPGNQFPTSIADCLGHGEAQKDGKKNCLLLVDGEAPKFIQTWTPDDADGWYRNVDWEELSGFTAPAGRGFIRVSGKASAAQAADMIKVVSRLRQASPAFVVSNAVKVEGVEGMDELSSTVEDIKLINVIDLLLAELSEPQQAVVRELLQVAE